jgi:hypothetical protein
MGLAFLLPLAMQHLEKNPLISGDLYPGDLLYSVLRVPAEAWLRSVELRTLKLKLSLVAEQFLARTDSTNDTSTELYGELVEMARTAAASR